MSHTQNSNSKRYSEEGRRGRVRDSGRPRPTTEPPDCLLKLLTDWYSICLPRVRCFGLPRNSKPPAGATIVTGVRNVNSGTRKWNHALLGLLQVHWSLTFFSI